MKEKEKRDKNWKLAFNNSSSCLTKYNISYTILMKIISIYFDKKIKFKEFLFVHRKMMITNFDFQFQWYDKLKFVCCIIYSLYYSLSCSFNRVFVIIAKSDATLNIEVSKSRIFLSAKPIHSKI